MGVVWGLSQTYEELEWQVRPFLVLLGPRRSGLPVHWNLGCPCERWGQRGRCPLDAVERQQRE